MEACGRQSERAIDFIYTFTERMSLFDTLTRPFGDAYRRCAWRQLDKGVYKRIKQNVVSLASYKGDTSFFACSGCVIDWDDGYGDNERQIILTSASLVRNPEYPFDDGNKIVDGLRIEAGIGGPLLDVHGNYMGMNFYDPRMGTPVLLCDYIVKILDFFRKWSGAEADNFRIAGDDSVPLNRWPATGDFCFGGDYERQIDRHDEFKYRGGKEL
ncbi:hypothetical protein QOZ80_6BG0493580 [Eleusine coracana subsp. coracana]|nr:hypothetical protein QOZ80_6BG0493580 [Eleusine coracana subsp. coracana]